jgi:GNAT superfamily N-acetyltransferase
MFLEVRPAAPADFEGWQRLWLGYRQFYGVPTDATSTRTTWVALLNDSESMHCALAVSGEESPSGLVHLIKRRSTWTAGHQCYLEDLFVEERLRGSGIGRSLIEYAYAWAKQQGCASVGWLTHESNATARRLYDRLAEHRGFIHYQKRL